MTYKWNLNLGVVIVLIHNWVARIRDSQIDDSKIEIMETDRITNELLVSHQYFASISTNNS